MKPSKQWTTALTPEEAVERLAQACAALDKIAHYTCHDEVYYGSPGDFAKAALDKVMEPSSALPNVPLTGPERPGKASGL
jgi:hypothetical protein